MKLPELHDLIDTVSLTRHIENMPFVVMLWNEELKLVYCSKETAFMFGFEPGDLLNKTIHLSHFVHEDDAPYVSELIADITAGRTTHNKSLNRNITRDGRLIYCQWYNSALIDERGKITNILSLCQDVTTQVEAEVSLKKTQQQQALAFSGAIDPMWLIRAEGNNVFRFEAINHAFTKVTGWTAAQVEGQPIEMIMPAASHDLVREKYNEAIRSEKIIDYIEEARHPSGIKYGEIRVIPVHGQKGDLVRILGIANDITEKVYLQKKLDAEREVKNRQITAAAIRGQEIERANVSRELHDNVNQVLTTVKLYIELCIDHKINPEVTLPKCASLLIDTINEIRTLSKQLSAPSTESINFKETLTDLVETMRTSMQLDVHIEFDSSPFLQMESEVHLTLYRVAQEQLTNIMKYAKATRVDVSLSVKDGVLLFIISDDGVGFDSTQKSKGIGITNMQSRVEVLSGRFQMISRPGEGTKLQVAIPVFIQDNVCYAEQSIMKLAT